MRRRALLLQALCVGAWPAWAHGGARLAAAWDDASGSHVGVLRRHGDGWRAARALDVPTRAHGLVAEPGGTVLAVARRPGDWLLRFDAASGRARAWHWIEPERRFTGHAVIDGAWLYTGETDLASGAGFIGARDARTLRRIAEWPTHGIDPHALLLDGDALWVANGGVPSAPESGRARVPGARIDSSLVRLSTRDGTLRGQWRVDDAWLSLRHLARGADGAIGIAMQAEHADAGARAAAPLLARFDGLALRCCAHDGMSLAGYGGDIAALLDGWAVSAPRADAVALWDARGAWRGRVPQADACALAAHGAGWYAGSGGAVLEVAAGAARRRAVDGALKLDNHWLELA
jgi:hypothetical protein